MLIILHGMIDKAPIIGKDIRKFVISTKFSKQFEKSEQIIIEDVGIPGSQAPTTRGYDSIAYSYKLASLFLRGVRFHDDKIEILISGSEGFDLGTSLRVLHNISNYEEVPEIHLFIETPSLRNNAFVLGRFYAWLKTVFLYDIFFNSRKEGTMKIVFLSPEQPQQLYKLLVDIVEKTSVKDNIYSVIDLRIKRFLFPLLDLITLSKLLSIRGRIDEMLNEYKSILVLLNHLLDEAPPDLWEIARKDKNIIWKSIFPYRRIYSRMYYLDENLRKVLMLFESRDKEYTSSAIDPKQLFEILLSGVSLYRIYELIDKLVDIRALTEKISNIPSEDLIRLFKAGRKVAVKSIRRKVFISEDIGRRCKGENIVVVPGRVNEMIVVDYGLVTICKDCNIPDYFPVEYENAYYERIGISMDSYYPEYIRINDVEFSPTEIHEMKLINYSGYKMLKEKKKEHIYKTIFDKIKEAIY